MALMYLCFFRSRAMVVSKTFEETADQTEEWYGTKYSVKKIPSDVIEVLSLF